MFNLLPEQNKKELKREYRRRVLTVTLSSLAAIFLVALVLLAPLYILSQAKKSAATILQTKSSSSYKDQVTTPAQEIERGRQLIQLFTGSASSTVSSTVIKSITTARPAGVTVTSISLKWDTTSTAEVQGTAATREALQSFSTALQTTGLFDQVTLPVSSFARDSNIPFTINMTFRKTSS